MSWTQVQDAIEITDYNPARAVRVKKMIWSDVDRAFRTHYFLRIYCGSGRRLSETIAWLQEQFGDPGYQRTWWRDPGHSHQVWLADNLATFWQLRWGDTV
jgi:hypothetical protein